jgi:hypothetical protein
MSKENVNIHSSDGMPDPSAGASIVFETEQGSFVLLSHTFRGGNLNVGGSLKEQEAFDAGARREANEETFADIDRGMVKEIFGSDRAANLEEHLKEIEKVNKQMEGDIDSSLKDKNSYATIHKPDKYTRRLFVCNITILKMNEAVSYVEHLTEIGKAFTEARQDAVVKITEDLKKNQATYNSDLANTGLKILENGKIEVTKKDGKTEVTDANNGRVVEQLAKSIKNPSDQWESLYKNYDFISTYSESHKFSLVSTEEIRKQHQEVTNHKGEKVPLGKFVLGDLKEATTPKRETFLEKLTMPKVKRIAAKFEELSKSGKTPLPNNSFSSNSSLPRTVKNEPITK